MYNFMKFYITNIKTMIESIQIAPKMKILYHQSLYHSPHDICTNSKNAFYSYHFTAEANSINMAINDTEKSYNSFVLITDSLSCLMALKSSKEIILSFLNQNIKSI